MDTTTRDKGNNRLGRGFSALLPNAPAAAGAAPAEPAQRATGGVVMLAIEDVVSISLAILKRAHEDWLPGLMAGPGAKAGGA